MYPQRSVMTCGLATALEPPHFNPRTCEGCDPQLSIRQTMRISFNPCIRVGCDFRTRGEDGTSVPVSIHAPAWGATPSSMALMASATVFQSTHPRGVRQGSTSGFPNGGKFQSTHPRGVRLILELLPFQLFIVSIHAPAWGATKRALQLFFKRLRFQSTHPRGVRPPTRSCARPLWTGFNPRTRVGCDASMCGTRSRSRCFNPRTRVGCDRFMDLGDWMTDLFQSTHPRGVRPCRRSSVPDVETVSIHAPAWGATDCRIYS